MVRLMDSMATTHSLAGLFSDQSVLQAMLDFEIALARCEASCGIIPESASKVITNAVQAGGFDPAALAEDTLRSGTPAIPFVKALTELVRAKDSAAAGFVHWGATSQDVTDTALVLLLKQAWLILQPDLDRLEQALRRLAHEHENTVILGRTLLQSAPPVTFGLKAAGWLGAIHRSRNRLAQGFQETLVLQFGGASGTLAALGSRGIEVGDALAAELGLAYPESPWHAHRDRLAALLCACGVLIGALGKMARDISLLMQPEVGEVSEPAGEGRGGSSTLPHKHNPVGCVAALACANRVPGLVAAFLSAMVQEHERGLGNWHAEWPLVSGVVQSTGLAIAAMAEVAEGLTVNAARMRSNIEATAGIVFAERAMMMLAEKLGRDQARHVLEKASRTSTVQGRRLQEVLAGMPEVALHLSPSTLNDLEVPEKYLGVAMEFERRALAAAESADLADQKKPKKE
ncbi:MAG TPA: 3-carboxy-cis,cis-muconate cycloisomerase, partial [Candidatus Angelobacter sp.]|nr:3-carboxy-cis,cis-muconate cycloisomerase [Candidatus Angelobacter sp.]